MVSRGGNRSNYWVVSRTNYISIQTVLPMLRWSFHIEPIKYMYDGSLDHLLSDLDGPFHFMLVTDRQAVGYFYPWFLFKMYRYCSVIDTKR